MHADSRHAICRHQPAEVQHRCMWVRACMCAHRLTNTERDSQAEKLGNRQDWPRTTGRAFCLAASEGKSTSKCCFSPSWPLLRMPRWVGSGKGGSCSSPDFAPHMKTLQAGSLSLYATRLWDNVECNTTFHSYVSQLVGS